MKIAKLNNKRHVLLHLLNQNVNLDLKDHVRRLLFTMIRYTFNSVFFDFVGRKDSAGLR